MNAYNGLSVLPLKLVEHTMARVRETPRDLTKDDVRALVNANRSLKQWARKEVCEIYYINYTLEIYTCT